MGEHSVELSEISIFVAAAENHSLTVAARLKRVPISTVSRTVKRIETKLGMQLLQRGTAGVGLTDFGQRYFEACLRTLQAAEECTALVEQHRAVPTGILRVCAPPPFVRGVLAPELRRFRDRYPKLAIHITLYCSHWDQEISTDTDVLLKVKTPKDSNRRVRTFRTILHGIFAGSKYVSHRGVPGEPSDLQAHDCLGYTPDNSVLPWRLRSGDRSIQLDLNHPIVISDPEVQLRLALDGLGIAILPRWIAHRHVERGGLVEVLPDWTPDPLTFCAICRESSRLSPKIEVFLQFLESIIGRQTDPRLFGNARSLSFATGRESSARKLKT